MRSDRKDPSQDDPQFMFNLGALNHLMGHCKKTKLLTLNSPNKEAVKYLPVIKQKKKKRILLYHYCNPSNFEMQCKESQLQVCTRVLQQIPEKRPLWKTHLAPSKGRSVGTWHF